MDDLPQFAQEYEKFKSLPWEPTSLTDAEETAFRAWLPTTKLFQSIKAEIAAENGLRPDQLDDGRVLEMVTSEGDYDYRGAFKDWGGGGVSKEVISPHDGLPHWPSSTQDGRMLKSPSHPTTWKEFFFRAHGDPDAKGLGTYEQAQQWSRQQGQQDFQKGFDRVRGVK